MTDAVSEFDALLGEITDMTKALPSADKADKKVAAAAKEGEENSDAEIAAEESEGTEVGKSFKLTLDDGTEVDAVDGTALFKSLSERVEGTEAKYIGAITGLLTVVKSLRDEVAELSKRGVGRKAVVTITEKPAGKVEEIAKAATDGITSDDFFAKALVMQAEGKITGFEIQRAETHMNKGLPIPAEIVRKVMGSK